MKHWRIAAFLCMILICFAQFSLGQTVHGSTDLDIDPDTGIVTATCETDADYLVAEYYKVVVSCTVEDSSGNIVAAGGGSDDSGQGYVQAVVTFAGVPGETYTAMSAHSLFEIYTIEYYEDPPQPIRLHYYDDVYDFGFYGDSPQTYDDEFSLESPGPETATLSQIQHAANTVAHAFAATPVQHNYPNSPFDFACWISSYFDATRTTGAHHADDVTKSNGGNSHSAPPLGTPVYAMEAGTVVAVSTGQPSASYPDCSNATPRPPGDYAKIKGTDNYTTLYFHMNPSVTVGQQVTAGQQIGVLDNSGCQSAPHLHVGRKDPQNNNVNFTIPCVNPLPTAPTKFDDGSIDDSDPDDW